MYKKSLIGMTFNDLRVVAYNKETKKWICRCNCGTEIEVNTSDLKSGRRKSCGCRTTKKQQYQKLNNLYRTIKYKKEDGWGSWENFLTWALRKGYSERFSCRKKEKGLPYSKNNLVFCFKYKNKLYSFDSINKDEIKIYYNRNNDTFNIMLKYNNINLQRHNIITIEELVAEHIRMSNRYLHKKSLFE